MEESGMVKKKWRNGEMKIVERGKTVKHIRWKGGKRVVTKEDGRKKNDMGVDNNDDNGGEGE